MRYMSLIVLLALTLPTLAAARTWRVPTDAPTIQAGIDSASTGDDVLVAPGEYFEHDITLKSGVWVHTEQGPEVTTVNADRLGRGFFGSDLDEMVTLEGFTIRNGLTLGSTGGGGVGLWGSPIIIRDCVVTDCEAGLGGGIYARGSALEISGCRVFDCHASSLGGGICLEVWGDASIVGCEVIGNLVGMGSGGGIGGLSYVGTLTIAECVVSGNMAIDGAGGGIACRSPGLLIRDCLVTQNHGDMYWEVGGILVADSYGEIVGCTVSSNTGRNAHGLYFNESEISVENVIVSFNEGEGVHCRLSPHVTFRCSNVYGNTDGDDLCGTDLGGNFSAAPLFCDPENGDYTLDVCSPCLPGNHPHGVDCGLIGARGLGCGATPVEETSWGRIKTLYRR